MALKEDQIFGKKASDLLADYWEKVHSGVSVTRTPGKFACVDGYVTYPGKTYFLEFMARKCESNKYDTTLLGKTQYNKIKKLETELGIETLIVVLFTDGVFYTSSKQVVPNKITKERVYLPMKYFLRSSPTESQTRDILDKYRELVG